MMKMRATVPIASGTLPKSARFRFEYSSCMPSSRTALEDDSLFILSTNGTLQIVDGGRPDSSLGDVFFVVDEEDFEMGGLPSGIAVSGSGEVAAVGTTVGNISQFSSTFVDPSEPTSARTCINYDSKDTYLPDTLPIPEVSLSVDAPVLAGAYTMNPSAERKGSSASLLSSFRSTPAVWKMKMKMTATRRVSTEISKSLSRHDYIGTAPNTAGFKENSMLYGSNARKVRCKP